MPWSLYFEGCFKPAFSLSSFTFLKRLFNSSSFSAIRVVSSASLRLLIFLPTILIPAYASFSLAFCMMYSACKLNEQGDSRQPWSVRFPIWNQSAVPCLVLAIVSWPAYRFVRRQVRCSGVPFFKISCQLFYGQGWLTLCHWYLKMHVLHFAREGGLVQLSEFWAFPFSNQ